MKKIVHLLSAFLLFLSVFVLPVHAENTEYVTDAYGLLDTYEMEDLNTQIASIVNTYQVGVYIRILDTDGDYSSIEDYAEELYREEDLGYGAEKNGILLVLDFYDRSYDLCAYGNKANTAFTDYGKNLIEKEMLPEFGEDNWYDGFTAFLNQVQYELQENEAGQPVDVPQTRNSTYTHSTTGYWMFILIGSPVLALIITLVLASKNKTKGIATQASEYISQNGVVLTQSLDLYSHTTRTVHHIPKNDDHFSGGTSVNSGGFSHSSGHF